MPFGALKMHPNALWVPKNANHTSPWSILRHFGATTPGPNCGLSPPLTLYVMVWSARPHGDRQTAFLLLRSQIEDGCETECGTPSSIWRSQVSLTADMAKYGDPVVQSNRSGRYVHIWSCTFAISLTHITITYMEILPVQLCPNMECVV